MHAACGRPAPDANGRPGLACAACAVAGRWTLCMVIAINVVHRAHHATTRMSMLALAHSVRKPHRSAHTVQDARPRPGAALCQPACVQPRIHQACKDVVFNVVHARARAGARCTQQSTQQGEHAGQGGARYWQRPGKDWSCWASRDGGVLAVVRQQLEASPCCTALRSAWYDAAEGSGRGRAHSGGAALEADEDG